MKKSITLTATILLLTAFTACADETTQDAKVYNSQEIIYIDKGKYDKTNADDGKAVTPNRKEAKTYIDRGIDYICIEEYDKAIADFNKVLELGAQYNAAAYYSRGIAHQRKGEYDKSIADLNESEKLKHQRSTEFENMRRVFADRCQNR